MPGTVEHKECGTQVLVAQREDCYYAAEWGDDGIEPNESCRDLDLGVVEPIQTGLFCPKCDRFVHEEELF